MSTIDLSSFEQLEIFTLATELAKTSGEFPMTWLKRLAKDALEYYDEHLYDPNGKHKRLILRFLSPDDPLDKLLDNDKRLAELRPQWSEQLSLLRSAAKKPSSPTLPFPATETSFSLITVSRSDFRHWFEGNFPQSSLPGFWFPQERQNKPAQSNQLTYGKSLELKIAEEVFQKFWEIPPARGYGRPTQDAIVDWILKKYAAKGITEKAAVRISQISKPDEIPRHGNIDLYLKPFPTPE